MSSSPTEVSTTLFTPIDEDTAYAEAVARFLDSPRPDSVPVWVGGRADLLSAMQLAAELYRGIARPTPYARGVLLGGGELPAGLRSLLGPLALEWLDEKELHGELLENAPAGRSLLVVAAYPQLTSDPVMELVRRAHRSDGRQVGFLTGRDAASLAWFTAKQFCRPRPDVVAAGLFTSTDRPEALGAVQVFDDRALERQDIGTELLEKRWRRLLLQGHGRDDSVNLADFTVCGLNTAASRRPELLGPRCAYGPDCYKPNEKLIPLNRVSSVEIVLSSCNNGPFADAVAYDPKYQLMLNAIDGAARDVVAAPTVHDSARPENTTWMRAAEAEAPSAASLNSTISAAQPDPAYWHFGMADDRGSAPDPTPQVPGPLVLSTSSRLTAYLAGGLLPERHALRPRLTRFAGKVERWVTRQATAAEGEPAILRALSDDLQSLDHAISTQIAEDPETEFTDCHAYFGQRSTVDPESVSEVLCHCGRAARQFVKRALVPTALDTVCTVCIRCGDMAYRLVGSPELSLTTEESVHTGGTLHARVGVRPERRGPVRIGVFVPRHLRSDCTVTPSRSKVRGTAGQWHEAEFSLAIDAGAHPQAYYFTAFAVQDLGLSVARWDFGVLPAVGVSAR
ncbi:hypothetical protein ACFQ6Q_39325, partial [Streptomyces sp. NPDC056437]|uniref:hypothetical protein n=1 Tax=Streptomyces sp. NPDC056437 TaxID=3345816 RepID=UPI0036973E87